MKNGKLKGQVAWISGGTKGIGEGTAKLFAEEGASVAVIGRNEKDGSRVVKDIIEKGGKALFIKCDVTKAEEVEKSIELTVHTFGGLQILINNAGIVDIKELHEYMEEEWDRVMDINVKSMFLAFKYAISAYSTPVTFQPALSIEIIFVPAPAPKSNAIPGGWH